MNKKYFDEIKAREKAATRGPWKVNHSNPWVVGAKHIVYKFLRICEADNSNDAAFIAHARTDIPALIAEVERLTAENAQDKKLIDSYKRSNLEQAEENYELEKENATLKKALELMHADMEEVAGIPIPNVDEYIRNAKGANHV